MSMSSQISDADQSGSVWSAENSVEVERKFPCLTEMSALGLIGGAAMLSVVLWLAIYAVL